MAAKKPWNASRHRVGHGLFDEINPMPQSSRTMRLLRILLVLAGAGVAALAQTNDTANIRQLSLQDCIQLTLQNDLDLQIDRYDASIPLYTLRAAYGAYDPTLFISGEHDHNEAGPRLLSGGFSVPGSVSDSDNFNGNITGLLPWGTTYTLGGNASDGYGNNFATRFTTNGNVITATRFPIPFENTGASATLHANQPLLKNLWIDSTRLNIRVAKNRLRYSEQTLRLQLMQTVTTLEKAYYELISDREKVEVQKQAVAAANQLVEENQKRVDVGALAPLDLESAKAQAKTSEADLSAARSTLAVQEHTIKQFITGQYSQWAATGIEPSGTLNTNREFFNLQDSWSKALSQRPELLQAKLDLEKAGIQLKYDRNQLFPELDVFGTFGYNGTGKEFSGALYDIQKRDRPYYIFGGSISIPLARTTARNNYRADKATLEQTILKVKQKERDIMLAIDNDIRQAQSNYEQMLARREAVAFAQKDLDAEKKKLESGKSTPYTVLQKQRDLTKARGDEIQAQASYNESVSQLSLDEASTFERLGLKLEVK
jgi:outer membrane protein TolC